MALALLCWRQAASDLQTRGSVRHIHRGVGLAFKRSHARLSCSRCFWAWRASAAWDSRRRSPSLTETGEELSHRRTSCDALAVKFREAEVALHAKDPVLANIVSKLASVFLSELDAATEAIGVAYDMLSSQACPHCSLADVGEENEREGVDDEEYEHTSPWHDSSEG